MHSYHLVLVDGTERDVRGAELALIDGSLVIRDAGGQVTVVYAPGTWALCELERKDDKG